MFLPTYISYGEDDSDYSIVCCHLNESAKWQVMKMVPDIAVNLQSSKYRMLFLFEQLTYVLVELYRKCLGEPASYICSPNLLMQQLMPMREG